MRSANNAPDFRTISGFRTEHLEALSAPFLQVFKMCRTARLVKLGHVAFDGTKVKANAFRHEARSYRRMKEEGAYPSLCSGERKRLVNGGSSAPNITCSRCEGHAGPGWRVRTSGAQSWLGEHGRRPALACHYLIRPSCR